MKINLLVDDAAGVREGWTNVDPAAPESDPTRLRLRPSDLRPLADVGEVTELVAHGVLDTLPRAEADGVLDHWLGLLAHGGLITLSCVDPVEVARALTNRVIGPDQAGRLLHGEQDTPWHFRHANFSLDQLVDALKEKGMKVIKQRVHQFRALCVAQRP